MVAGDGATLFSLSNLETEGEVQERLSAPHGAITQEKLHKPQRTFHEVTTAEGSTARYSPFPAFRTSPIQRLFQSR